MERFRFFNKYYLLFIFIIGTVLYLNFVSGAQIVTYVFNTSLGEDVQIINEDIIRSSKIVFQVATHEDVDCKYSKNRGLSYISMESNFEYNFGTLHKINLLDLEDGEYRYYVKCRDSDGQDSGELEAVFRIMAPVSAIISLSEDSPLGEGLVEIEIETSKVVQGVPSLAYSFDSRDYDPISLSGSGKFWEGNMIIEKGVGERVGSFKFGAYDLEGIFGENIIEGKLFLVDTIKPRTIVDVSATGYKGRIDIEWRIDETDISYYNIYRSTDPEVDYSDYYKKIEDDDEEFLDTQVKKGETYYYRVTAVDDAGNEGDLSIEVTATALIDDVGVSEGSLPVELYGLVDSFVTEIELLLEDLNEVDESIKSKSGDEKDLIEVLALNKEVVLGISDLRNLKTNIERYKSQNIDRVELEKKLKADDVKLESVKKRVPEGVNIFERYSKNQEISEDNIRNAILELQLDFNDPIDNKRVQKSIKAIEEIEFNVEREVFYYEIVYFDGTRDEQTLVKESIGANIGYNQSLVIYEFIPQNIVDSVDDLEVLSDPYNVEKKDTILSFSSDTRKILYRFDGEVEMNRFDGINTILVIESSGVEGGNSITGYFSLIDFSGGGYFWIFVGVAAIIFLGGYLFVIKKRGGNVKNNDELSIHIEKIKNLVKNDKIVEAKSGYEKLSKKYENLEKKHKSAAYKKLIDLRNTIEIKNFEDQLSIIYDLVLDDKEKAYEMYKRLCNNYDMLDDEIRIKLKDRIEELGRSFK